jgi:hypothetical protein
METFELSEQDIRELENPEVACAVDALLDFMESCPESWGRKPKGSIVPLVPRHYDSDWLAEFLSCFLSVPYFVEAPEIRAWLLKVGIFSPHKQGVRKPESFSVEALQAYDESNLRDDLQSLRKVTQDEVLERVKTERPDLVERMEESMKKEEAQFLKTAHLRDLVFKRALQWMKKNKQWISESPNMIFELPEILSAACAVSVEIEYHQLLEELKMRQYVEIAPLEPEETDEGYRDEVIWHLDHLDLRPRKHFPSSKYTCGRLVVMIITIGIMVSSVLQIGEKMGWLMDPNGPYRR